MKCCQFQLVGDFVSSSLSALDKVLVLNARTWTRKTLKQQLSTLNMERDAELLRRQNDLKIELSSIPGLYSSSIFPSSPSYRRQIA